ncbi:MAG: hypothetical protein HY459_05005 [Parcubacteria group bacterium]|nr:hypothetical protein [Parcubacteria group bacterium]
MRKYRAVFHVEVDYPAASLGLAEEMAHLMIWERVKNMVKEDVLGSSEFKDTVKVSRLRTSDEK